MVWPKTAVNRNEQIIIGNLFDSGNTDCSTKYKRMITEVRDMKIDDSLIASLSKEILPIIKYFLVLLSQAQHSI